MRQHILISNDDGINAKGLRALIEVASNFGDVTVVAPETGMSGMSHAITMNTPLYLRAVKKSEHVNIYACHGTPVDCIKIAMDYIIKEPPTLILSGINHGANSNMSVIYSGTMGAAMEGSMYDIPSIGFSILTHSPLADFTACKKIAHTVIEKVLSENKNPRMCLNVNIPNIPYEEIKGIVPCRQALGCWYEDFTRQTNPRGQDYFWLTGEFKPYSPQSKDDDEYLLSQNYVSIVPVQTDITDYKHLEEMKKWSF